MKGMLCVAMSVARGLRIEGLRNVGSGPGPGLISFTVLSNNINHFYQWLGMFKALTFVQPCWEKPTAGWLERRQGGLIFS